MSTEMNFENTPPNTTESIPSNHAEPKFVSVERWGKTSPITSSTLFFARSDWSSKLVFDFLETLRIIIHPLISAHGLRIKALCELDPSMTDCFGNFVPCLIGKQWLEYTINGLPRPGMVRLHVPVTQDLGDEVLIGQMLDTLCHELAHSWYRADAHGDWFVRKWAALRRELEQYLGGNVRVRSVWGISSYDARFEALAKEESDMVPKMPDQESIRALENWKKAVAEKWRPLIAEKAADKEATADRWFFKFPTSVSEDRPI